MENKTNLTSRAIIRQSILTMEQPFYLSELFKLLEAKYGITNRPLTLKIMEELCESGAVKYSEVADDDWAYIVIRRMPAYTKALSH